MAKRKKKTEAIIDTSEELSSGGQDGVSSDSDGSIIASPATSLYLSQEVAEVFELLWAGGHTVEAGSLGRIDFRQLTLASAEKLHKAGAKFLKRK